MTFDARIHGPGAGGDHHVQTIDLSVTRDTTNSLVDMDAVIEIDVARKMIHTRPLDGLTVLVALSNGLQKWAVHLYLNVAIHAGFGGRKPGKRTVLNGRVAVSAIEPEFPDMQLVTVWNGLGSRQPDLRHIRRPYNSRGNDGQSSQ